MKIIHFERKEEVLDESAKTSGCLSCGMSQDQWKGNFGKGYAHNGEFYCCLGCADGDGCGCWNTDTGNIES